MAASPKPNLFVIGATKCGTTTLHSYLASHPRITMSSVKEPGFFLSKNERHPQIQAPDRDEAAEIRNYLALFPVDADALYRGESSTAYTHLPHRSGVTERILAFSSRPRCIYVMRDPVERTISHYWWNVQTQGERRSLDEAVRVDPQYQDISHYAMQLRPYLEAFGRESVRAITFEALVRSPETVLAEIFEWLSLESSPAVSMTNRRENPTPKVIEAPRLVWLERFRHSDAWTRLGALVPAPVRRMARSLSQHRYDRATVDQRGVVEMLRPVQREQTRELSELLDRDFPDWLLLNGDDG